MTVCLSRERERVSKRDFADKWTTNDRPSSTHSSPIRSCGRSWSSWTRVRSATSGMFLAYRHTWRPWWGDLQREDGDDKDTWKPLNMLQKSLKALPKTPPKTHQTPKDLPQNMSTTPFLHDPPPALRQPSQLSHKLGGILEMDDRLAVISPQDAETLEMDGGRGT